MEQHEQELPPEEELVKLEAATKNGNWSIYGGDGWLTKLIGIKVSARGSNMRDGLKWYAGIIAITALGGLLTVLAYEMLMRLLGR